MESSQVLPETEKKMNSAIEAMSHDFASYRTGRAAPQVLDRVHIDYYGTETPISQVANVSVPEPRQLYLQPYDKSMIPAIERAILKSDLGISPVNDGAGLRLNFPSMTEDRRKEMVKMVHSRTEQCRVAIRNIRRDANDTLKGLEKKKEITEDDLKGQETRVQKLTDTFVSRADDLGKKKEEELMKV